MTASRPFFCTCVSWPSDRLDVLGELQGDCRDITLGDFAGRVEPRDWRAVQAALGYATGKETGLRIAEDFHVRYRVHGPTGIPFLVHSAIEHVFARPDEIEDLHHTIEARAHQDMCDASHAGADALVLVHPGSLMGSLASHVGKREAQAIREEILAGLRDHAGPLVVIDGMLSDELGREEDDITAALDRAAAAGLPALRLWGCDAGTAPHPGWSGRGPGEVIFPDQEAAALAAAASLPAGTSFLVTGAWASRNGGTGCVTGVAEALAQAGHASRVAEDAALLPEEFDDQPEGDVHGPET